MKSTRRFDRSLDCAANKLRENVLSTRRVVPAGASLVQLLRETIDSSFYDNLELSTAVVRKRGI